MVRLMIFVPHLDDGPYAPEVGELYWIDTTILDAYDKRPRRPGLVVEVPADPNGRLTIVTRTTNIDRPGVYHDADPGLGLNRPGVFAYLRTAEAHLWTPELVTYLDRVDAELLAQVLEEFGL